MSNVCKQGERGLTITWLRADLAKAPPPGTYDLVTAHFLHIPRAEQPRRLHPAGLT